MKTGHYYHFERYHTDYQITTFVTLTKLPHLIIKVFKLTHLVLAQRDNAESYYLKEFIKTDSLKKNEFT